MDKVHNVSSSGFNFFCSYFQSFLCHQLFMNMHMPVGINDKGGNENEYAFGFSYEFNPSWKVGLKTSGFAVPGGP